MRDTAINTIATDTSHLTDLILSRDVRATARAISMLERDPWSESSTALFKALYPHTGKARVIGVTGAPGVGKSTLVDGLTRAYRGRGRRVGVLAIDPTSPFTGGAVLGDRIRMQEHAGDPDVFIRSMATRGHLGGLSPSVPEALVVLDAAGYDTILIETVGVGQDEVEIVYTAETRLVVLAPGMGDDVQTLKAGIMEIADIFVLNKCDREGTATATSALSTLLEIAPRQDGFTQALVRTVAVREEGIAELLAAVESHQAWLDASESASQTRRTTLRYRVFELLQTRLRQLIHSNLGEERLNTMLQQLQQRRTDPYTVVDEIVRQFRSSPDD